MAAYSYGLILCSLLWIVSPVEGKEFTVTCGISEDCMLPCVFQSDGKGARIMWFNKEDMVSCTHHGNTSFVGGSNLPADEYKGRTGMFGDQVLKGNATLLLKKVTPKDEGKYFCITYTESRTATSGIVSLLIKAPVDKIDVQQDENRITCSSEGIYPEPELTWSTRPRSSVTFKSKTKVQRTERLLYNISSSLILSHSDSDLSYTCTISTDRNSRRVTLFKPTSLTGSSYETTIPCTASNTPQTGLMWKFDHSQIILTQTRADDPPTVSEGWRQQVKGVSESGSLMLQHLSPSHEGTYTCELTGAEETLITNTFLRIEEGPVITLSVGVFIGVMFAAILVSAALAVTAALLILKKSQPRNNTSVSNICRTPIPMNEETPCQNGEVQNHTPLLQPNRDSGQTAVQKKVCSMTDDNDVNVRTAEKKPLNTEGLNDAGSLSSSISTMSLSFGVSS